MNAANTQEIVIEQFLYIASKQMNERVLFYNNEAKEMNNAPLFMKVAATQYNNEALFYYNNLIIPE